MIMNSLFNIIEYQVYPFLEASQGYMMNGRRLGPYSQAFATFLPTKLEAILPFLKVKWTKIWKCFSFESNVFIKFKRNIFRSFKRIDRRIAEILECKIADFKSLHNRRAVGKIVGNKTYDVTVSELKKCGKFETVLVSS